MCVEEDVRWSARSIVDGTPLNHDECRRTRQMNPDIDTDLGMKGGRECDHE